MKGPLRDDKRTQQQKAMMIESGTISQQQKAALLTRFITLNRQGYAILV